MPLKDLFEIGHIAKTHGLNGEFSIKCSVPQDVCYIFRNLRIIYIENYSEKFLINSIIISNNIFLKVQTNIINSREQAKEIIRKKVYIKKGNHTEIDIEIKKKFEFINYLIINLQNQEIGKVKQIKFNKLQSLFVIKRPDGICLIPFVEEFISNIDRENKIIYMNLPEGLIEACTE